MENFTKDLVNKYANDCELGAVVRNLINNHGEDLDKIKEWGDKKLQSAREQNFEKAAEYRKKEKEILDKIKKSLHLL